MNSIRNIILTIVMLLFTITSFSQEIRTNSIKALTDSIELDTIDLKKVDRFDRWAYSDKKSDAFFYLAPMFQYGTGTPENAYNLHHDFGVMHRWFIVDNEKIKINFQGWLEQRSFWAGETTKDFSKKTGMISSPNGSSSTEHDMSLESFYFEFFLLSQKLDVTLGKFDPLFFTVFTNYSGWDKYNYFSKSAASDPVPDLDAGMGLYSDYHVTKRFSFGGLIVDNEPVNNFLYVPDFNETSWNYMGFMRFKFGNKNLYSDHNLAFYHQSETMDKESGSGFIYSGNQGLTENTILILKFSKGTGRVDKLNSAYVAGLTFLDPLNRSADQAGFAMMVNEKDNKVEVGLDTYYRFFLNPYVNIAPNFQVYYTMNDRINTVLGFRAFISY